MIGNRRWTTLGQCLLAGLLLHGVSIRETAAVELRFRLQCTVSDPVVKLGDVADVIGSDRAQVQLLSAMELFPAPGQQEQRFVRVREIQDLLILRGVNLAQCQFSGSSQVTVSAAAIAPVRTPVAQTFSAAASRRIQRRVCEAVSKYLEERVAGHQSWTVEAELTDAQVRAIGDTTRALSITGGSEPWTGTQNFEVTVKGPQGPATFALSAQVGVRPSVVVAVRSLPRGATVREGDVELQNDVATDAGATVFHTLAEVMGRETTRSIAAGRPVAQESLRTPLMVHRGDVVTVHVSSSGIHIRTAARARDDGSQGDLIAVESMQDRKTYFARVSGIREVEVYARAPRVDQAEAIAAENTVRR